ncbi:hypothetical protein E4T42_07016 [Aureobasidium subglaciale]|nr:hypothetical protein E4T42_07016 [Aureobasidium subglaciale]
MPQRAARTDFQCLAPRSEPGNHGSDSKLGLQGVPFHTESANIWIGYRDLPEKKYLGVFPSYHEMISRCRQNVLRKMNSTFPRFITPHHKVTDKLEIDDSGKSIRRVCCTACHKADGNCEVLALEVIPVMIPPSKAIKAYLLTYNFNLKDQKMVALVYHISSGYYWFQKTDGTLSETIGLQSRHTCTTVHANSSENTGYDSSSNDSSDDSTLTQFDSVGPEDNAETRISPRVSLRSSQWDTSQRLLIQFPIPPATPDFGQKPDPTPQAPLPSRGCMVVDLTDEDEDEALPIKHEYAELQEHPAMPVSFFTPPATSAAPSEDLSFTKHFSPDPLAEEFGRITTQIFQEYSMRVFALPEVVELVNMMKQAVKDGDRAALCRVYGALQAFLITVD